MEKRRDWWEPLDYIVALIVLALALIVVVGLAAHIVTGVNLTERGLNIVAGVVTAFHSAVTVYIGAAIQRRITRRNARAESASEASEEAHARAVEGGQ